MQLQAYCPTCHARYWIGQLDKLPQTTRLMTDLAELLHGHTCKTLDKGLQVA